MSRSNSLCGSWDVSARISAIILYMMFPYVVATALEKSPSSSAVRGPENMGLRACMICTGARSTRIRAAVSCSMLLVVAVVQFVSSSCFNCVSIPISSRLSSQERFARFPGLLISKIVLSKHPRDGHKSGTVILLYLRFRMSAPNALSICFLRLWKGNCNDLHLRFNGASKRQ